MTGTALADYLRHHDYRYANEAELQHALLDVMRQGGLHVEPEVPIEGGRIDFLVGSIGIEVKVNGNAEALRRQITGYAADDRVSALVVVTSRYRHTLGPRTIGGKPVEYVYLGGM